MANKKIEFTADFSSNKKGDINNFSENICNIFVYNLKVAKFYVEPLKNEIEKTKKTKK